MLYANNKLIKCIKSRQYVYNCFHGYSYFQLAVYLFKLLNIYVYKSYKVFVWYFLNNYKKTPIIIEFDNNRRCDEVSSFISMV